MKLAEKTIFYTLARFSIEFVRIGILMLLARLLSKNEYGTYRQVWIIAGVLGSCLALGLPNGCFYFIPKLEGGRRKFFIYQVIAILVVIGLLACATLFLLSDFIGQKFMNPELAGPIRIYAPALITTIVSLSFAPILLSLDKTAILGVFMLVFVVVKFMATIIPAALGASLKALFLWVVFSSFMESFAYLFIIIRFNRKVPAQFDKKLVSEQFKFVLPIGFSNIYTSFSKYLDKFVISTAYGPSQFAVYSNGAFDIPFISTTTESVISVITPKLVKAWDDKKVDDMLYLWHESIRQIGLILIPAMVFLFIFADDIMVVLFSKKYIQSADIFRILLLEIPHLTTMYLSILLCMGFSGLVLKLTILSNFANIILVVAFMYAFGYLGPPIARVVNTHILCLFFIYLIQRKAKVGLAQIYPWKVMFHLLWASTLAGMLIYAIKLIEMPSLFRMMLAIVPFGLFLFFIFRRLGILRNNDIERAKKLLSLSHLLATFRS